MFRTMGQTVIKVENVSKQYRLGVIGTGSFSRDLHRMWLNLLGKEDPYVKIGEENDKVKQNSAEYIWALKNISFDIKQGDVVGIIGKNGAGKSTLLKILSRTTSPTTGSIKVRGRIASLLEVGTGFHPELTGRQNIFLNGAILGMTKYEITNKFDEIVDFSGVEKYIDTPVKRYSSGMYVRLAFAVAAHLDPEILIVDEVLAVGDAEFQKKALGKIKSVSQGSARTVLFVSHQLGSIKDLCSKGIYLKNGLIRSHGEIQATLDHYLSDIEDKRNIRIKDRLDREGNGDLRVTAIRLIRGATKEATDTVFSGDNIVIEVDYDCTEDRSFKVYDLHLGMPIFSLRGQNFLTALNNKMANFHFPNAGSKGTLICEIDNLPLMSGSFFFNVNLFADKVLEDRLEEAFSFVVEPTDYYKSGTPSSFKREGLYINQRWSLREYA